MNARASWWPLVAVSFLLPVLAAMPAHAAPATALIEGILTSTGGGAAADGDYAIVFSLYKDEQGGSPVWSEGPVTVKAAGGQFNHALGSATAIKASDLTTAAWLGVKIGSDPELPRRPLHAAFFAIQAAVASNLACSGCITAGHLDAAALQDYAKTADLAKVALSGAYADLSGAPDLAAYAKVAALADVAKTGAYADLAGAPDLSVYAKTAGLAKVATTGKYTDLTDKPVLAEVGKGCGSGLWVVGLKADGTLDCAPTPNATLPGDAIDEVSNGLIWNQFTDTFPSSSALAIPDNNPIGAYAELTVGDVGLAQKLTVSVELTNSDISGLQVLLYDAANQEYMLYNKSGKKGDAIKTSYPDPTKTVSGDLTYWEGKNPKGTWRLKVIDTAFLNNATDGQVVKWSVNLQTLSSKKIRIAGDLIVEGTITNASLAAQMPVPSVLQTRVFSDYTARSTGNGGYYYYGGSEFSNAIKPQKADSIILITINYFGEPAGHDTTGRLQYSIDNGPWKDWDLANTGQQGTFKPCPYDQDDNSTPCNSSTQVAKAFNTTGTIAFRIYHFNGGTFYHNRSVSTSYESGPSTLVLQELSAANSSYVKR